VVVDEASMLDLLLANRPREGGRAGAHLLLVGDVDQLPSVGPVECCAICSPTARRSQGALTQVFGRRSNPAWWPTRTGSTRANIRRSRPVDFFLFAEDDAEEAAKLTVDVVARRLPAKVRVEPAPRDPVLARCTAARPALGGAR